MATKVGESFPEPSTEATGDGARYTRVAIFLHWAIALLIIWNLASGFVVWDLAKDFFKANRPYYVIGLITHLSAGMTILVLTVARIAWRLMHEPPAYPPKMKGWERHTAHFVHFLLYAGMLLMPLTGWAILSAHPPAGSPGAKVARPPMAAPPTASPATGRQTAGGAPGAGLAGPPPGKGGMPPRPKIWWVLPLPVITPIENIGVEPGGVKPQQILHDEFAEWHKVGGYLMLLLLFLHIGGALKHQFMDREPELQRIGLGRRKRTMTEARRP